MIYIVTTTINVPTFLKSIKGDFKAIVIGDVKTPKEAKDYCKKHDAWYLDLEAQEKAVPKELFDMFPLNSATRKMIGTYLAYQAGADSVIMMDDDNYPVDGEFIHGHGVVVRKRVLRKTIKSSIGWFNTGEAMVERYNIPYYPRGYPWSQRFIEYEMISEKEWKNVVVNQGMVLGDPDIDAVSRLFWPISVNELKYSFALASGTWSCFNDQNTAISREIIPVYFKPPSGGRNADIWTGFVIQRLTEHMGDVVAFGQPLVNHYRNPHDLREDYRQEELSNIATDDFIALLRSAKLTKDNYLDALGELLLQCLGKTDNRYITEFMVEYLRWFNFMKGVIK